jgi:hypothetical protein
MKKLLILFCAVLFSITAISAQTGKSTTSTKSKKAAVESTTPAKAIAVHEFRVEGVDVALMEVTRTAPEIVTVKWEYRNKTAKPADLAVGSKGWSDPYRLSWDAYLLESDGKTKLGVMKDNDGHPLSATHGATNQKAISVAPKKTLKTWAKYSVPAGATTVTVVLLGADPFESVTVSETPVPRQN